MINIKFKKIALRLNISLLYGSFVKSNLNVLLLIAA